VRILTYKSDSDLFDVRQVIKKNFNISSALLTMLKNSGGIKVNGKVVTVRHILSYDDVLTLEIPAEKSDIVPVKGEIEILYEDEDVLCVNKPCCMPTHPSQNHHADTLANVVMYYFSGTDNSFHAVNRLDSYTSGVVVIAKNAYSASILSGNLQSHLFDKHYVAICNGIFSKKQGRIIEPIGRAEGSTIKRCVSNDGKYAETHYKVIAESDGKSLVELQPITGRTHQIRVHMAHIGHSLHNDFLYDSQSDGVTPFSLHCKSLTLIHPHTNKKLIINAEISWIF